MGSQLTNRLPCENNRTIENFFHQKMSHIISLKVTKFQQPLLITLGIVDEKPERGEQKAPPPGDIGLMKPITFSIIISNKQQNNGRF